MRGKAFVGDQFEIDLFIRLARAFLDRALDGVAIDRGFAGLFHGGGQARVGIGVRAAELGGDHDFADQFGGHLALLLRVGFAPRLFPLCAHSGIVWETLGRGSIQIAGKTCLGRVLGKGNGRRRVP